MAKGKKCECDWPQLVSGVVVLGLGFYLLIGGFLTQWNDASVTQWITVLGLYAAGFFLMALGKGLKHQGCGSCPAHAK